MIIIYNYNIIPIVKVPKAIPSLQGPFTAELRDRRL